MAMEYVADESIAPFIASLDWRTSDTAFERAVESSNDWSLGESDMSQVLLVCEHCGDEVAFHCREDAMTFLATDGACWHCVDVEDPSPICYAGCHRVCSRYPHC